MPNQMTSFRDTRPLRKVSDAPAHRPRLTGSMMNRWCLQLIGGFRLQVWEQISHINGFGLQHAAEIVTGQTFIALLDIINA